MVVLLIHSYVKAMTAVRKSLQATQEILTPIYVALLSYHGLCKTKWISTLFQAQANGEILCNCISVVATSNMTTF